MSLDSASGVVLRTRLLTETSLIVHWLTAEQGRLSTVAQGARRPKSPLRGKLDLWFEGRFSFQRRRRSDLHRLREIVLTDTHPALRTRIEAVRQAAYAGLLIESATEPESPVPALHRLFTDLLGVLNAAVAAGEAMEPGRLLAFEWQLLAVSGLQPPLAEARLSPGARTLAQALADVPLAEAARLPFEAPALGELERFLGRFLADHLGRVPRGRRQALAMAGPAGAGARHPQALNTSPALASEPEEADL